MPGMRTPLLVLVLAALVTMAVVWWSSRGEQPPPAPPVPPTPASPGAPGSPPSPERGALPPAATTEGPTAPAAADPATAAPATTLAAANVQLRVRDLATRQPVPSFRWRFRNALGSAQGTGQDGAAGLALLPSALGELLVEADDHAPYVKSDLVVPTPPDPALLLDVFLAPAVPAAGITLHVRDLALQPIAHVRVDAFVLSEENRAGAWHLGPSLWARLASAADGRYVLPTLPPGEYGLRVAATDADGASLPLLPFVRTFALTGDNGFVEDVPLEPGCLLVLDLVDAAGQPFDPARHGAATLRLSLPAGPPVRRKWLVRSGGVEAVAVDTVPGVGPVELADAVRPGTWQLEVAVQGEPRVQHRLLLAAGVRQRERVVVP